VAVSLAKGQNVSLDKVAPGLKNIFVGLGWDARSTDGQPFDLDSTAILLKSDGLIRDSWDFVFYNNLTGGGGSVEHAGDNLDGQGSGDDEVIRVSLNDVPTDIQKVVFAATIHEADVRHQTFGQVANAFIRVVNRDSGQEIARFDLSEDSGLETAMIFGELYRRDGEWKFKAIGHGFAGGLPALVRNYGGSV
jgi:tellurium resistance protein TerD